LYQKTSVLYRRLLVLVKPFSMMLILGLFANFLFSGVDAGFTYALKPFLNKGFVDKDIAFVRWIPLFILVGITFRGVISALAGYCMTSVARNVIKSLRQKMFSHIIALPARYFDQTSSGQLLSKILYDVEQVAQVSADVLATFVQSVFLIIGLLTVMFVVSWQLSLLFLTTIPFVGFLVAWTNRRIRRVSHAVQRSMGEMTNIAEEVMEGYKVVRIFGGQDYETKKFKNATDEGWRRDMKVAATKAYNVAGIQIMIALGIAMIIFAAIQLASVIVISAGGFVSIIAAMLQLIKPLKSLADVNSVIQRGMAGAESVFALLDEPMEADKGKKTLVRSKGHIVYQDLSFAYKAEMSNVLEHINLQILPGQTIAFVGRSGSGKSTLVHLLAHFYDSYKGKILIDDIDIRELTLFNLREQMALVSQNITLFNDTLRNNIAYGISGEVSAESIEQAAISAHAMEFIRDLPQGLDTLVGENGVLLSGGQRQRIAIARAILKNAPILILDEATSALDTESERYIQDAMDAMMKNRTTLVIAHRLSTVEKADHIVVLDKGHIIEQGKHSELLAQEGAYASLYRMQFSDIDNMSFESESVLG
jgi:subfamily B ATP-binding cassette protein MsbA